MSDKCFVDTNILVYAHDRSAGAKSERAKTWRKVPQTVEQADYVRRWPTLGKAVR